MKKAIITQTNAHITPKRFWDVRITEDENFINSCINRKMYVYDLTNEGDKKLKTEKTYCFGDIAKYLTN